MKTKTKFQEFYENPQLNEEGVEYVDSLSDEERHLILMKFIDIGDVHNEKYKIFLKKFKKDCIYLKTLCLPIDDMEEPPMNKYLGDAMNNYLK